MRYSEAEYVEIAECGCPKSDNTIPANITKYQSNSGINKFMKERDYNVTKSAYIENSALGKTAEFEGITPSAQGEQISRGRLYYGSQCIASVTVTTLRTSGDAPRAIAFLNSARKLSTSITLPTVIPAAQATDAVSRLKALKDLLDQKLITPSQYEAKRQSIVDGM
jgi:hypothetical protein